MFKQSPSRNHRSKGLKVKHVLQICVLLAIGIWLIYQVKHSHGKSRVFETKVGKDLKLQSNDEIVRFGRKDIPRITEILKEGEKNEEDDEEKEGEEEENKHEDDELEKDDVRLVEREEERGDGDDEIDEHEPEKTEVESEHEEEVMDEDKEKEDKEETEEKDDKEETEEKEENEEKEEEVSTEENEDTHEKGHSEEEESEDAGNKGHTDPEEIEDVNKEGDNKRKVKSDEHDHVAERTNTREAQEELYRADDASSEVTHNVQSVLQETENSTMDHSNRIWGEINVGQKYETNTSDNSDGLIKPRVQPREDVDSGISNATNSERKKNVVNLTKLGDIEITANSTVGGAKDSVTLLPNGTKTGLDSNLSQNGTVELPGHEEQDIPANSTVKRITDKMHLQEAAADTNIGDKVNSNTGETQSSHKTTLASSHATNDTDTMEAAKDSSVDDETHGEKAKNNEKEGSDENSESQSYEGTDAIKHDPIDASDISTLAQEEKESRTDLDTLPDIRTEVKNTEDTVAE